MLARPIVVLLALLSAPASAQSIADFAGEWQDARQNVHVSQQVSGDGFHVVVTTPGDPSQIEGWLYPTRAPHVFAAEGTETRWTAMSQCGAVSPARTSFSTGWPWTRKARSTRPLRP